ncbi:hypothetical protein B0H10DRAFT_2229975 [Mycena sp. CBHHK59/15]|nr:hypothetical protein B0H10DRAFT_2229975 [Mycena sp. CBHHK59/15]
MIRAYNALTGRRRLFSRPLRRIHSTARRRNELYDPAKEEWMEKEADVCILGAGAAIRLKQLEKETGKEVRVVVLEKGAEVGSHILSAPSSPSALDVLLPDWRTMDHPLSQPVTSSSASPARPSSSPPPLTPPTPSRPDHSVPGVPKNRAHGSLAKAAIARYALRYNSEPQTYGIGIKEVWRVDPTKHVPGEVVHTLKWPLEWGTYGGGCGWVYHMHGGLVSVGLGVGLDYKNAYIKPYRDRCRMKHHPYFRGLLAPSPQTERLVYGARARSG